MSRQIHELSPGTLVYIYENTVAEPYIYLGLDGNGHARLLRERAAVAKRMNATDVASYAGCEADLWLEDEQTGFLSRFSQEVIRCLEYTDLNYWDYNQGPGGTRIVLDIARRCFLLAYDEVGFGTGEGNLSYLDALKTYRGTTSANTARIAYSPTGPAVHSWLRSGSSTANFWFVSASGSSNSNSATVSYYWLRPALSVAPSTSVSDEGADIIFLLPEVVKTYWEAGSTLYLGPSSNRPRAVKVALETKDAQELTVEVCNNYLDSNQVWEPCVLNTETELQNKTATAWELGCRIYAKLSTPVGYIGEPIVLVAVEE